MNCDNNENGKDDGEGGHGCHTNKRAKHDVLDAINPDILSKLDTLRATYESAKPYPHCFLTDLLDRDLIQNVLTEIKDNSKVDFKESDLFKFYQSMDLANFSSESAPHILKLRELLYSDEWRHIIERILSLPHNSLSNQVDCACNCHAYSCHLLCHDDVIRTRKVSYILYLVGEDWTAQDGGALELYSSCALPQGKDSGEDTAKVPATIPSARVTPKFNSMGIFVVEPGVSFHSVQEVLRTSSPRLSLQGWYHSTVAPVRTDLATLTQLKTKIPNDDQFQDYENLRLQVTEEQTTEDAVATAVAESSSVELQQEDYDRLAPFLDPSYLQPMALQEMRERFEAESSLQLRSLFLPKWVEPLAKVLSKADKEVTVSIDNPDFYDLGVSKDWSLVGPPHMQRYLRYEGDASDSEESPGALLAQLKDLLESPAFVRFLSCITGLHPNGYRSQVRRFRPGRDYTVAHYGLLRSFGVLDATLVFCAGQGEPVDDSTPDDHPDVKWQSGDCGGFECYIEMDEEGEDEEYKNQYDDDTELLSVSAANNTLSLVYRDPGTMRFVKYLSCHAPSSRWDISVEYRLEEDKDDDEPEDNAPDT